MSVPKFTSLLEGPRKHDTLLVVVHGFQGNHATFGDFPQSLRFRYGLKYDIYRFCYACDDHPHANVVQQLQDNIQTLVEEAGFNRLILFGHSCGGVIIARALVQNQQWYQHQIHLDGVALFDSPIGGIGSAPLAQFILENPRFALVAFSAFAIGASYHSESVNDVITKYGGFLSILIEVAGKKLIDEFEEVVNKLQVQVINLHLGSFSLNVLNANLGFKSQFLREISLSPNSNNDFWVSAHQSMFDNNDIGENLRYYVGRWLAHIQKLSTVKAITILVLGLVIYYLFAEDSNTGHVTSTQKKQAKKE